MKRLGLLSFLILSTLFPSVLFAAGDSSAEILHLLNRITYGPTTHDVDHVHAVGIREYIEEQLAPEKMIMPEALQERLAQLQTLRKPLDELAYEYIPEMSKEQKQKLSEDAKKELRKRSNIVIQEMRDAKLLRAMYSPAQLQELMIDFWFNHFNVFEGKGPVHVLIGGYERDAIRPYAMGKFRDLVMATAKHPAMLVYLDNWLNTDPNSRFAKGRFKGLNENCARELMELHTLGVDGGYTQKDVTTLAQILTGFGLDVERDKSKSERLSSFYFDARRHDNRNKQFFGYYVYGSGEREVEAAIDLLARNSATAHHICYKLAEYFVADNPPDSLVREMQRMFELTDGDIRQVLHAMLLSREFWDPALWNTKFKPPLRYAVSAIRLTGITVEDTLKVHQRIEQMGQPLYHYLTPDGYPATNDHWLNSDAVLKRIDFAKQLVSNRFAIGKLSPAAPEFSPDNMRAVLGMPLAKQSVAAIDSADKQLKPVLILSSPEFLYY